MLDSPIQPSDNRAWSFDSLPVGPICPGEGGEDDKKELFFSESQLSLRHYNIIFPFVVVVVRLLGPLSLQGHLFAL